jgi:hypothetical protein
MTEGDDLRMTRADFKRAVKQVLTAPLHPTARKAKAKKPAKKTHRAKG